MTVPFLDLGATYRELKPALDEAYRRVMESGWFIHGAEVGAFEAELAAYLGARHAVGVANGLDAIELALRALGIGPGDEVIVPSHTFIASWLGVSAVGARPVPVECRVSTGNIDPTLVEAAVGNKTRAVLAVHLYGQPAECDALGDICARHGLALVEDAAQAQGARFGGRRAGTLGRIAAFSFYPGKNLGAYGDAGAVVTDDDALADRVRVLGNYGSRKKYVHDIAGRNSRLDELQAALLRPRLAVLDAWNDRRRAKAARYLDALGGVGELILPAVAKNTEPVWHLFVVRHPRRDALAAHLGSRGIGTLIHYPTPPHLSGAYTNGNYARQPIAEALASTVLSLPIGPHLSDGDQATVIDAVRSF